MNMFKDLSDVEVRQETITPKSDLDTILDTEAEIIKQYEKDKRFELFEEKNHEAYLSLYTLTQEKLKDITLTQTLLQEYIDARDNSEENTEALIRGMYSAALLEIISITQPDKTTLIDGRGKTFNYLFYHIHNVKNFTIKNITGYNMLFRAGSHKGNVKNGILHNITGVGILYESGWYYGSVKNITLQNITGDFTLYALGSYKGSAENITLNKVKGDGILEVAGRDGGNVKNITLHEVKGENTLYHKGHNVSAGNILEEKKLDARQKSILSRIETIVETIHPLSSEDQTTAHDEIERLQTEIFSEVT